MECYDTPFAGWWDEIFAAFSAHALGYYGICLIMGIILNCGQQNKFRCLCLVRQGWYSPTENFLVLYWQFILKSLLREKTVIVELGKYQLRMIPLLEFVIFGLKILKNHRGKTQKRLFIIKHHLVVNTLVTNVITSNIGKSGYHLESHWQPE